MTLLLFLVVKNSFLFSFMVVVFDFPYLTFCLVDFYFSSFLNYSADVIMSYKAKVHKSVDMGEVPAQGLSSVYTYIFVIPNLVVFTAFVILFHYNELVLGLGTLIQALSVRL
jgi:hypothetical protein